MKNTLQTELAAISKRVLFMFSVALLAFLTTFLTGCGKEQEQEKKQKDATSRFLGIDCEIPAMRTPEERKKFRQTGSFCTDQKQNTKQK